MTDLRCACGQRVGFRHRPLGFEHIGFFFDLGTGAELEQCPACWTDLGDALREGDLVDVTSEARQ